MSDIVIRELQPEDAEKLIAYIKRIGGETDNLTFGPEGFPVTVEQEKAMLRSKTEHPKSVMYGAWRGEELVGDGSLDAMPRRMSHRAELGLTVVKEMWNKGIGSRILEKLIEYAKEAGIEILNLEVRSDNLPAIHLYEKYGFQRIGTSPAFFKIGDTYYDFEIMYLDLRAKKRERLKCV